MEADNEMKIVLVTGTSSGLGLALVEFLLSLGGYRVIGLDKEDQVKFRGDERYTHLRCDLLDFEKVKLVVEDHGVSRMKLFSLVNCAGVMPSSIISSLDPDKALKAFALNCVAPIFLAKILLKALARASNSSIVNVTSIAADINIPGEVIYGATKSALRHASESMSIEFARFGIRVNCVAPALVATPLTQHLSQNQKEFMFSKQAHSQEVRPHDVAVVIQSIIEGSKFVTGSTLYVGGVVK